MRKVKGQVLDTEGQLTLTLLRVLPSLATGSIS